MPVLVKILLWIFAGWVFAGIVLALAAYLNDARWSQVLMWHWKPIYALAGDGPLLGYDSAGEPIYEGTPVHILFNLIGVFAGFIIYPTLFALIANFLIPRRKPEVFSTVPPPPQVYR